MSSLDELPETKTQWRRKLRAQRGELDENTRSAQDAALQNAILSWVAEQSVRTVTAYVPIGGEPGSPALLDALRAAGVRVLLPITIRRQPLDWTDYTGPESLRPTTFGSLELLEPAGPRLGPAAIAQADALLVPALAVDHQGIRLGQGAGHYDRSLPMTNPAAPRIGVVRDVEFVTELPGEPHDVRMTGVVTPLRGIVSLPM